MRPQVLTSEGTVTIPAEVQKRLGLKAGDSVDFVENDRGETVLKAESEPVPRREASSIMDLVGVLKWDGPPVSIEEMNQVIEKGWATGFKEDGLDGE